MKKITLALILAVLAALTAMFTLTSCGDAEDGNDVDTDTKAVTETAAPETDAATDATTDTATVANAETEGSVFPQALSDLPSYPITDLDYTSWEMAGGMVNGNDMTEEEFNAVLTACGGFLKFAFNEAGSVEMENGEKTFEGTYELLLDGYALHLVFDGYEYYGVLTESEGAPVFVFSNVKDSETALYFIQIEEG